MRSIALVIALVTALIAPAFACGLVPWQLCGYGRSDWSTKLIRGLISEEAAGFRSRRGPSHDSTLVTPHNAPFSTYKEARVHQPVRRHDCGMVACRTRAGVGDDAGDRTHDSDLAANRNGTRKTGRQAASESSIERGPN